MSHDCPYCGSQADCPHLLLEVDSTFREAKAGALQDAFQEAWRAALERGERDTRFDERAAFQGLLDAVNRSADAERSWDVEGGPGGSCSYVAYFCEAGVEDAVERFRHSITPKKSAVRKPSKGDR